MWEGRRRGERGEREGVERNEIGQKMPKRKKGWRKEFCALKKVETNSRLLLPDQNSGSLCKHFPRYESRKMD